MGSLTTFVFKTKIQRRLVELPVQILEEGLVSLSNSVVPFFVHLHCDTSVSQETYLKIFANKPACLVGNGALLFPFSLSLQLFRKLVER